MLDGYGHKVGIGTVPKGNNKSYPKIHTLGFGRQGKSSLPVHRLACMLWLIWKVCRLVVLFSQPSMPLTRIFHESLAATTNMGVLPGVLGCRLLRRTVQVRLGTNPAVPRDELPGGTPIFVVSRQQFMNYPGLPGQGRHGGV